MLKLRLVETANQAFEVLKVPGNLLIYPTDTLWGIGCMISNTDSMKNLFSVKKRDTNKPVSMLVSCIGMAKEYAHIDNNMCEEIQKVWPGNTTFVVKAKTNVPWSAHRGTNFVGLRCIDHPFMSKLIQMCQLPITTTSANLSGKKPVHNGKVLLYEMPDYVYCVNDDTVLSGPASKVIKLDDSKKEIIR